MGWGGWGRKVYEGQAHHEIVTSYRCCEVQKEKKKKKKRKKLGDCKTFLSNCRSLFFNSEMSYTGIGNLVSLHSS